MATGLVYQLDALNDSAKQKVLIVQSKARGLEMTKDVAQYLLRQHSRDLNKLMSLLQSLDKASMSEQRRLTIPFVRQILRSA
jgi:DnaA family protein